MLGCTIHFEKPIAYEVVDKRSSACMGNTDYWGWWSVSGTSHWCSNVWYGFHKPV